jgi:hypothetical protein
MKGVKNEMIFKWYKISFKIYMIKASNYVLYMLRMVNQRNPIGRSWGIKYEGDSTCLLGK